MKELRKFAQKNATYSLHRKVSLQYKLVNRLHIVGILYTLAGEQLQKALLSDALRYAIRTVVCTTFM